MKEDRVIIRRNKNASIAKIISAAAKIFSKKGYAKTTYSEIAKVAGLNISLISRYFESKDALFEAAVDLMMSKFKFSFDKIPENYNFKEDMHFITDFLIDIIIKQQKAMEAVINVALYDKNSCKELYKHNEINTYVVQRLEKFQKSGDIHKSHDLQYLTDTFLGIVNSMSVFYNTIFGIPKCNIHDRIHYVIEMFAESVMKENKGIYPSTFECIKNQ